MRRVRPLAAAMLGVLAVLGGLPASAAADPAADPDVTSTESAADPDVTSTEDAPPGELVSFGIAPAGVDRPDQRPYLAVTAPAGAVIYEHAALINQGDVPIELQIYSGDVIMADGGLSVRPRADASTDAGGWITFDRIETVTVPAQTLEDGFGYVVVPFAVTIPADAEPGDHVAGIVASSLTRGEGGENSPAIEFEQRVVARVYITVDGELGPGLAIADVVTRFEAGGLVGPGSVVVEYTLRNTGNVRMGVEPSVDVAGPFGLMSRSAPGDRVDELLPGGEVRLTTTVTDVWPLILENVTISATAVGTVGRDDPGIGTVTASTRIWAVPWLLLGLLLLLVALVVLLVVVRRRRPRGRRVAGRRVAPRPGRRAARTAPRDTAPGPADEAVPVGVGPGSRSSR